MRGGFFASGSAIKQGRCHPWRDQISGNAGRSFGRLSAQHQRRVQPENHRQDGHPAAEIELPPAATWRCACSASWCLVLIPHFGVLGASISCTVGLVITTIALNMLCRPRAPHTELPKCVAIE
jgi:hypothetical protein